MDIAEMHRSTGAAFDEAAQRYEEEVAADIEFLRGGGENFCAPELPFLAGLSDWCRRAIHLQCAGGRDTLSLWNHGAAEVVGVDISPRMIACARRKSEALAAPATWYCCDVLDTPAKLDATADLVYTGRGALYWMMDIEAWARVVARLLKPGGRLYVFEGHPLNWIWDHNASELCFDENDGNYFLAEPQRGQGWDDQYIGKLDIPVASQSAKYERQWNLGQVVNAVSAAGLRLERLEEHPEQFYDEYPNLPADIIRRLPHTYSLLAHRPPR